MSRVRGWCPSAHRPMLSGDGLLVRVRPPMARLSVDKCRLLAELAERFGNGLIDLTSRGNLQIRGVHEGNHAQLLAALVDAGLVEGDVRDELPLTVTPFPDADGVTERLVSELMAAAVGLPELPAKIGIIVDTGEGRCLQDASGDFRFERGGRGVILRADGAESGQSVAEGGARNALVRMADWFVRTGGANAGRMRRHLSTTSLPDSMQECAPDPQTIPFAGPDHKAGTLGLAFGRLSAEVIKSICSVPGVSEVVFTPWRAVIVTDKSGAPLDLSGSQGDPLGAINSPLTDRELLFDPSDPLAQIDACPGAPECNQASVATRKLAMELSNLNVGVVHVSGCEKGCARRAACPITLVGREGRFDVVINGRPGDTPDRIGLAEAKVIEFFQQRSGLEPSAKGGSGNSGQTEGRATAL